ncbi:hypothetical protein [Streptomyces sp. NPDC056061]|uniref:hypothetical protein n=1 Tax=Streptomyces sp. NPDC056061 TaxID=3345700 RepID=UPI0035DDF7A2
MPAPARPRSTYQATDGVEVRLPWWAIALPSIMFAVLLLLVVSPGEAHAATADPAVGRLFARVVELLTG